MLKGEMERGGDKGTRRRGDKKTKNSIHSPCLCISSASFLLVPLSPLLLLLPLPSGKPALTRTIRSDEDYGLRIRDLEFGAAARVRAEKHIVYANQVIAGFRELGPVEIACAARQFLLPRAPHPPDLEFVSLTALRTRISGRFRFLLLDVKISFVHSRRSLHRKRPSTPNLFRLQHKTF